MVKEERVIIKVYDKDQLVDTFDLPLKFRDFISFPDRPPYHGLRYYICGCYDEVYEFTPDAHEFFVKFSTQRVGQIIEYLVDRSYKITFQAYTKDID